MAVRGDVARAKALRRLDGEPGVHTKPVVTRDVADEDVLARREVECDGRGLPHGNARDLADLAVLFRFRRGAVDRKLIRREIGLNDLKAVLHRAEVAHADLDRPSFHARHVHRDLVVGELGDDLRARRRLRGWAGARHNEKGERCEGCDESGDHHLEAIRSRRFCISSSSASQRKNATEAAARNTKSPTTHMIAPPTRWSVTRSISKRVVSEIPAYAVYKSREENERIPPRTVFCAAPRTRRYGSRVP